MIIPIVLGLGAVVAVGYALSVSNRDRIDNGVDETEQPPGEQDEDAILDGSEAAEDEGDVDTASALRVAAIVEAWRKQAGVKNHNLRALLTPYWRARVPPDRMEIEDLLVAMPDHVHPSVAGILEHVLKRDGEYPWRLAEIASMGETLSFGWAAPPTDIWDDDEAVADWIDDWEDEVGPDEGGLWDWTSGMAPTLPPLAEPDPDAPEPDDPLDEDLEDLLEQLE